MYGFFYSSNSVGAPFVPMRFFLSSIFHFYLLTQFIQWFWQWPHMCIFIPVMQYYFISFIRIFILHSNRIKWYGTKRNETKRIWIECRNKVKSSNNIASNFFRTKCVCERKGKSKSKEAGKSMLKSFDFLLFAFVHLFTVIFPFEIDSSNTIMSSHCDRQI